MDTGVAALLDLLGDTAPPTAPEIPSSPVAEPEPAPSTVPPPQMGLAPSQDRAEPSGAHFMAWLRQSIQTRKLIINDAKALVHTVAGTTYLVSPGVFQRYAQEYLQVAALAKQEKLEGWQWVEALRETGTAPQAAERAEHLDLRSHGAAQVATAARLPARQPGCAVPGDAARQPIPAARQRGRKARRFSPWGQGRRSGVGMRPLCGPASICGWGRLCQLGFGQSHQVGGTAFQRTGNLEDERERGDMLAALDLAHVRPFDAGHVGQRFLSDALVGSFFPHGSPKRDGWFRFVGSGAGGAAPLDRTLWHCQERRTRSRFKPR